VLRTGILPGLLRAVGFNRSHGLTDVALFEVGRVFLAPTDATTQLPDEPEHLAVVLAGSLKRAPLEPDRPIDVYDAIDALRAVGDALQLADLQLVHADTAGFRRGRAARVVVDGTDVGAVGEVAADVVSALDLVAPVVAFEVELDGLGLATRRDQTFVAPSRFPASMIDLAFVLDATVPVAAIERTVRTAVGDLLEDVRCFDEFTADSLGEGKRSLAFSLRFRAADRTLAVTDVTDARQRAIDAVTQEHDATLR
ncbi:MAG: phenylalanine--tRNA ligase subunit beta, partial [Acidimicrobiia bacterium]